MRILLYMLITLVILAFTHPLFASDEYLTLTDDHMKREISIESLRQQADTEITIFAPFRGRDVKMRGVLLDTLLKKHLHNIPKKIKLIALDGYEMTLENWVPNHWLIVTHEDDQPLTLRQRGPLRLIGRDYAGRDPKNLRAFNDWIWMLQGIETLP